MGFKNFDAYSGGDIHLKFVAGFDNNAFDVTGLLHGIVASLKLAYKPLHAPPLISLRFHLGKGSKNLTWNI